MDGSGFNHLPIRGILTMAAVGVFAIVVGGLCSGGFVVWWIAHHITVH